MITPADLAWPRVPGVFVTGTDTGVGKTVVSCALIHALSSCQRVSAFKPVATGCGPALDSDDAQALAAASGLDADAICPVRYALPLAPAVAAELEAHPVDWKIIHSAYLRVITQSDFAVVEGAGGLLVPFAPGVLASDLAAAMQLPLLVVARPGLGTLNHTLLTVEAAERRGLRVAGVVISGVDPSSPDVAEQTNPRVLGQLLRVPVVAVPKIDVGQPAALARAGSQIISACQLLA